MSALFASQKLSNRALYYHLVNANLSPEITTVATNKIDRLLWCCRRFSPPFAKYNQRQFTDYIKAIYQQEASSYQPLNGYPKISKAAYIWGIVQMSPLVLVDGCWLQNSHLLHKTQPEIAKIFATIYADETGDGVLAKDHRYIFRQLLGSLQVAVPEVASLQFSQWTGFIDSAFEVPCYMLAIGHFPQQFLPELLGLNLAIELAGLGKDYPKLVDEMRYWNIDPAIVSIHIAADNYTAGHSFLAQQAVKLYLAQIGDETIANQHWRRIYCGFISLRLAGLRFKLALPLRYLAHKYCKQCKQFLAT